MKAILPFLVILSLASAFVPVAPSRARQRTPASSDSGTTATARNVVGQEFTTEIEASRTAFFIWFFGASGAAGVARSAFPRMYKQVTYIQSLAGMGPTQGGETLGLSPLCGYPQDIAVKDVQKVVNNPLTIEQIVNKYPVEGNFLAKKGYITFAAFEQANKNANPLAVRAVFDTFAQSTDVCDPDVAQAKIDSYKQDVTLINPALLKAKATGFAAIGVLLFLLGLADIVAAGHAYHGWFPEWPGGENFPQCILDPETGPWTIPKYWI